MLGRWGQFLGHRGDVQLQPGSLTSHLSYEGEETELPFPGIPRDTSKSTSGEELSSLPSDVEAPRLLAKAKYYRQQGSSHQSHSQRETGDAKPPRETTAAPSPLWTTTMRLVIKNTNKNHTTTTPPPQPSQPLTPFILQYTGVI